MSRTVSGPELSGKDATFQSFIDVWVDRLELWGWKITIRYQDPQDFYREDPDSSVETVASCTADWKYMYATILVNRGKLAEMKKSEIEETVVHELMHIMLNEMRERSIKHEERVATLLARSFLKRK